MAAIKVRQQLVLLLYLSFHSYTKTSDSLTVSVISLPASILSINRNIGSQYVAMNRFEVEKEEGIKR